MVCRQDPGAAAAVRVIEVVFMCFGEKLKKVRKQRHLTQRDVAEHLHVTRAAVSRWENGDRYPDLMAAKSLADYLKVSLDELLQSGDS